jgi:membrane protein
MRTVLARLDRYQRRRPWLGLPLAVFDKFVEDRGPLLAGLITYYGFLSLFPLLLVLTTTLRLVLHDHPEVADALLGTALARFPVVGAEVTAAVHPLEGSAVALGGGVLVALYGGLGFTTSVGHAFDQLWAVPVHLRPHPIVARARGALLLVLLGVGLGVTASLSALTVLPEAAFGQTAAPTLPPLLAVPVATAVNTGLFLVAYRALTVRPLTFRQVAPGALLAALAWQLLELGVLRYAGEELTGADPLYGVFGLVLALLAWIYLEVLVVLVAAEINTVLVDRLWPRALLTVTAMVGPDDLTDADRRGLANYARVQTYKSFERIDVTFGPDPLPEVPEVSAASMASPAAPSPSPHADRCPPGSP